MSASDILASHVTPMEKVVELLDVLGQEVAKEGNADKKAYYAYVSYYTDESEKADKIIKEEAERISILETDLQEAEAVREGKNMELNEMRAKHTKANTELTTARKQRSKDRAVFEENEDSYVEAFDALKRSADVMKLPIPDGAAASASLLSVAQNLKETMTHSAELSLSAEDLQTLENFVHEARLASPQRAASFLQQGDPAKLYSQYDEGHGKFAPSATGVLGTLTDLRDKVKKQRDEARVAERKAKREYKTVSESLSELITNAEKSIRDCTTSIAQSQEESARKSVKLLQSRRLHEKQVAHRAEIESVNREKTSAYKKRLIARSDEVIAIHNAQRMLQSEVAKDYMKKQGIGKVGNISGIRDAPVKSALQISHEKLEMMQKVLHVMRHANTPGLALMALKAARVRRGPDPFKNVKTMIKANVAKLYDEQAKETTRAAFCERELASTQYNTKRKGSDRDKMNSRLDALQAELSEITADIETTSKDLGECEDALDAAIGAREKEQQVAKDGLKEFKDAAALVNRAIGVLQKYYGIDKGQSSDDSSAMRDRKGLGVIVIGMLEIARDDFKKQYDESKATEEIDAADFQKLHTESSVRIAIFKTQLKNSKATKAKLELEQASLMNDLKSNKKELDSLSDYAKKLNGMCMIKAETATEKQVKISSQLKSLKEVLDFLKGV